MTLTRRFGALAALALTLVLGACSTPADVSVPGLEAQFGTANNDVGVDVTVNTGGNIMVLSEETGSRYDDFYGIDTSYEKLLWKKYDKNGNLVWETEVNSDDCSYEDYYGYNCVVNQYIPKAIFSGSSGYTYALFTTQYKYSNYFETYYRIYKYDAAGNYYDSYNLGNLYSYTENDGVIDATIDGSGNIYVAKVQNDSISGSRKNVIAKYTNGGSLVWQVFSTVGIPLGISVGSNSNVYVGGSTGVARYTNAAGSQTWKISGDTRDVAAVGTNTVYARNLTTVRKLDANGKQLWSKTQTGLSSLVIGDMATDSSANVYITGKYNVSSTNRDVFTRKLAASSGTTSFSKTFGASVYDDARGIATLTGSEIYLTGATKGPLAPPYQGGEQDGYVRKLNSVGTPVWTR